MRTNSKHVFPRICFPRETRFPACFPSRFPVWAALAFCLLLVVSTSAGAALRIGSWNLLHYGWANSKNHAAVAAVAAQFDLIAVQELMKPEALRTLARELESRTGENWKYIASGAAGSSTYTEDVSTLRAYARKQLKQDEAKYVLDGGNSTLTSTPFVFLHVAARYCR